MDASKTNRITLDRWDALAMLAIGIGALALRLVHLDQVWSLPFFEFPLVDAQSYDEWAQRIAAGDWLGDRVFYQAPAYPYFLALVYSLFGHDLWAAHVVQMVLGALSCSLIYGATRLAFDRGAAIAAGVLLAVYAPALFFDGILQKAGLGLFLTSLLLLALAHFLGAPRARGAVLCGALAALLSLTRENALAFAVVIPVWFATRHALQPLSRRLTLCVAFAAGLAGVLLPVGVRNLVVGDTFAVTTSQMGPNFYIGNNPRATGLYAPLLDGRHTPDFEGSDAKRLAEWQLNRELTPGEVSSHWMRQSLAWIRDDPGAWLSLLFVKALYTINDFEIPDTEDIHVHAESSRVLSVLHAAMRFGVLFPLGVAGMVFAWRERRRGSTSEILFVLSVVFAAAVTAFYVWARYRFPLVPLLLPFAGLALARGADLLRRGELRALAAPAACLLVAAAAANLDLLDRRAFELTAWTNLGNIMLKHDRLAEAESYLLRAREIDEDDPELRLHLGILRFRQGRYADSERHLRAMIELQPTDFRGHRAMARLLRKQGRAAEAKEYLLESARLDPGRKRRGRPGAPPPSVKPRAEEADP